MSCFFSDIKKTSGILGFVWVLLAFLDKKIPNKYCEANLFFYLGCVFGYFSGSHKNDFQLWFLISFKSHRNQSFTIFLENTILENHRGVSSWPLAFLRLNNWIYKVFIIQIILPENSNENKIKVMSLNRSNFREILLKYYSQTCLNNHLFNMTTCP